jgi:hypothetical protein
MVRLKALSARAKEILRENGLLVLLKSSIMFLIIPFYERNVYYLFKYSVKNDANPNKGIIKLKMVDIKCQVVTSNIEADRLESENYYFRSYPTDHNEGRKTYSRWLDQGAIAFCTFVRKDFAAITWVVTTQQTQDSLKLLPIKIGYSHKEAFGRGAWVNPKYRKLGLYGFTITNRDRFLTDMGITTLRNAVHSTDTTGRALQQTVGSKRYGEARAKRILFWRFWSEVVEN